MTGHSKALVRRRSDRRYEQRRELGGALFPDGSSGQYTCRGEGDADRPRRSRPQGLLSLRQGVGAARHATSDNRYTFSGKEKQHLRFQEIDYADFGARFYDSEGVMFLQQDPMSEKYYPIGQYNYCLGNPIRLIDPNGMETTDALEEWIEELEKEIDDMRRRNNAEIARYEAGRTAKNSKRTDRKIKKQEARNARLDQVTKEIAALRDSDQLIWDYHIKRQRWEWSFCV